jgi:NarL family two-component system response regulator YdfI
VLRVLVVDDHALFRRALRQMLAADDLEVVGDAADGAAALRLVETLEPDVVVLDVRMPGLDGVTVGHMIRRRWPEVAVLLCSNDARADLPDELPAPFLPKEHLTAAAIRDAARTHVSGDAG